MGKTRYNRIVKLPPDFNIKNIPTHVPRPTESDYEIGYIERYFTQKLNDQNSYVYEISRKVFTQLQNNTLYKVVSLDWVINGEVDKVKEYNRKSLVYASKDIKHISLYLPNLLQFFKK